MFPAVATPAIAIIIPIFKHSALLPEAIEAALKQEVEGGVRVVVVDDGCPFEETRAVASAYALAEERVTYLRKTNGGLSSARNFGIDFALRAWPGLEAVYFLDADNRLTPTAMRNALALMRESGADWIYPSIDKFGIDWSGNYAAPYSRLAHVAFDNISEAGSLVARRVFEAGIRFDEAMRHGYEDWEFWLQALGHGFKGRCHPQFGLEYRQRGESMLRESGRLRAGILHYMREKHRALWRVGTLLRFEHEEAPRYALFGDAGVTLFSDPDLPPRQMGMAEYAEAFAAEEAEPESFGTPPYLLWLPGEAVAALRDAGIWANLLWQVERLAATHDVVAIRLAHEPGAVRLRIGEAAGAAPDGWAMKQTVLREALRAEAGWLESILTDAPQPRIAHLSLWLPIYPPPQPSPARGEGVRPAPSPLAGEGWGGGRSPNHGTPLDTIRHLPRTPTPRRWTWRDGNALPERRDLVNHLGNALGADHVLPRARHPGGRLQLGFAVPRGEGRRLRIAAALARALREQGAATHLFIMEETGCRHDAALAAAFDSINLLATAPVEGAQRFMGRPVALAGDLAGADRTLLGLLGGLDLLVASGVPMLAPALADLRKLGVKALGLPLGREDATGLLAFEHALDLVLAAPSLADWLHGQGVPLAKLMPWQPATDLPATPRGPRAPGPLRCLLLRDAAEAPAQERQARAVLATRMAGLPLEWSAIGPVPAALAALGVEGLDAATRTEALLAADLLVLPATGEAAAIDLRDAQLMGCVPLLAAGDPAAALLRDGVDGLLVEDPRRGVVEALRALARDPARLAALSAAAAAVAPDAAADISPLALRIAGWFPDAVSTR